MIREIEAKSGATVEIDQSTKDEGHCTVHMQGDEEGKRKAYGFVVAELLKVADQPSSNMDCTAIGTKLSLVIDSKFVGWVKGPKASPPPATRLLVPSPPFSCSRSIPPASPFARSAQLLPRERREAGSCFVAFFGGRGGEGQAHEHTKRLSEADGGRGRANEAEEERTVRRGLGSKAKGAQCMRGKGRRRREADEVGGGGGSGKGRGGEEHGNTDEGKSKGGKGRQVEGMRTVGFALRLRLALSLPLACLPRHCSHASSRPQSPPSPPTTGRPVLAAWPPTDRLLLAAYLWPTIRDDLLLVAWRWRRASYRLLGAYCWSLANGCLLLAFCYCSPIDRRLLLVAYSWPPTTDRLLLAYWPPAHH